MIVEEKHQHQKYKTNAEYVQVVPFDFDDARNGLDHDPILVPRVSGPGPGYSLTAPL